MSNINKLYRSGRGVNITARFYIFIDPEPET